MSVAESTVLTQRQGRIAIITLNRPRALNALDQSMIDAISASLDAWREDPAVHAVVLEGAGGRAFCAGGDVRALRALSIAGDYAAIEAFFAAEYALNLAIARYPKPYVSLIDGICMGGGIGLSVHGGIRIATEKALFGMPETGIGLFPDVGATFVLPRLRGDWGLYLGLTGARVGGADAAWLGLATHVVRSERLPELRDALAADGVAVLSDFAMPVEPGPAMQHDVHAFGEDSVAAILAALEAAGDEWSQQTLATIRHASPSSVLWTFEILRRGAGQTLEACLRAELALTRHAVKHPDFLEGVRAMVVDKDRTPHWSPATVEAVPPAAIAALFLSYAHSGAEDPSGRDGNV